jgi:hypothetical protein
MRIMSFLTILRLNAGARRWTGSAAEEPTPATTMVRGRATVQTPPLPSTYDDLAPTTTIALTREPACFAFLCALAEHPPLPIDALHIEIASADHYAGRSSVWATLEIRSAAANGTSSLLGFDEMFLPLFARAFLQAATTRKEVRVNVVLKADPTPRRPRPPCVVEHVSGVDIPVPEFILIPCDQVVLVAADVGNGSEETLFQLPRTDSFLRSFARMTYEAGQALRGIVADMDRIADNRVARMGGRTH